MTGPHTVYYVRFDGRNPGVIGRRIDGSKAPESGNREPPITDKDPIEKPAARSDTQICYTIGKTSSDERREENNTVRGEPSAPGRTMLSGTFTRKDVARFFGLTESRLKYWDRSDFLSPSGHNGNRRCYTFADVINIRTAKTLLDGKVSLQRVRKILQQIKEKIPQSPHPINRLRIMSDAKTVVVVEEDCEYEADTGQLLLDLSVRHLEAEVVSQLPVTEQNTDSRTAYEWFLEGCRLDEDENSLAQAEQAYHQAIHLDPSFTNAYTNLGNLLYRTGNVADAKALYQKAIEVDEKQPEAHYNLGFIEFEQGHLEQAANCFAVAVELDATFADAHFNLALTLFRLDQNDRAKHHWECYLKIEPEGPWADVARERLNEIN